MPCRVKCSVCGHIWIDSQKMDDDFFWRSDWYYDLYLRLRGKCPRCGHKLPTPQEYAAKMKVEVFAAKEVKT